MLPPTNYLQARTFSMFHIQARLRTVALVAEPPCEANVDAEVIRVFRGWPFLRRGSRIKFSVSVSSGRAPVGGTLWIDFDELTQAEYLEVYLFWWARRHRVVLSQLRLLQTPADAAVLKAPSILRVLKWRLSGDLTGGEWGEKHFWVDGR